MGDSYFVARIPNCIGWIYHELGLIGDALTWDERAVRDTAKGDWPGIQEARANSLLNLASDLIALDRLDEAAEVLGHAAAAAERDEFMRWRNMNRVALCLAALALGRDDGAVALIHAQEALAQADARQSRKYMALAQNLVGRSLYSLGRVAEGCPDN